MVAGTLLLCLLAMGVAGCARKEPVVATWAYDFRLGTFKDNRPQNDDVMLKSEPFTVNSFMRGWSNSVGRSVFANVPAKMDVVLHHYETTSSGSSYAINMDVTISARDMENKPLGRMNAKCDAVERITPRTLWDFGQQARGQGTTHPLTAAARNATMWQKVMDSCVAELAKQFDTSLAEGAGNR